MENIDYQKLKETMYSLDKEEYFQNPEEYIENNKKVYFDSIKKLYDENAETRAVIGFDIYKYSQYTEIPQFLIPFLLKNLLEKTVENINKYESFLFQGKFSLDKLNYIDTGDGGYVIFETPIHALTFAIHMSIALRQFNSYLLLPITRDLIKELNVRFSLTYDKVFLLNNNIYGAGIINNSRILSKDKLNRFIIDDNTNEWFLKNMNGIDMIRIVSYSYLSRIDILKKYIVPGITEDKYGVFSKHYSNGYLLYGIDICNIQKIGIIHVKKLEISIYNIYIQGVLAITSDHNNEESEPISLTLGNLNSEGLVDESS
jgi:hypothetical protein